MASEVLQHSRMHYPARLVLRALLLTCFLAQGLTWGQEVTLAMGSGVAKPGESVSIEIFLNTIAAGPAALQWTIGYPAADITSIDVIAGPAATASNKTVACLPSPASIFCIVYGLNDTVMSTGVIATVRVTISPSTGNPASVISLFGAVASDPTGSGIPSTATGGVITIDAPLDSIRSTTVATNPPGLSIVVDGTTYGSPQVFDWSPGSTHDIAAASQESGPARFEFAGWNDGGSDSHTITVVSLPATFTATFRTSYLLKTNAMPSGAGTVQTMPTSADGFYLSGSFVQLIPIPEEGYRFDAWMGDLDGAAVPATMIMNGRKCVIAAFVESVPTTPAPRRPRRRTGPE